MATAASGDDSHMRVSSGTGQVDGSPFSGSRMMPLANEDAAELGWPGRTEIVGRRRTRPSTKPLREYSLTSSSPMALSAP